MGEELAFWTALFVLYCTVHSMARHGMEIRAIRYRTAALHPAAARKCADDCREVGCTELAA